MALVHSAPGVQLLDGLIALAVAEGLRPEYRQRLGRSKNRRHAGPDQRDPLAVSQAFSRDGVGRFTIEHADDVGYRRQQALAGSGAQILVLEFHLDDPGARAEGLDGQGSDGKAAAGVAPHIDDPAVEQSAGVAVVAGGAQMAEERLERIPPGLL